MLISVQNLNKIYCTREGDNIHALRDINFEMQQGEFVTVVTIQGASVIGMAG